MTVLGGGRIVINNHHGLGRRQGGHRDPPLHWARLFARPRAPSLTPSPSCRTLATRSEPCAARRHVVCFDTVGTCSEYFSKLQLQTASGARTPQSDTFSGKQSVDAAAETIQTKVTAVLIQQRAQLGL